MSEKNITPEQHAKMLLGGMNDLMERKRKSNPQFYTKEFTAKLTALIPKPVKKKKKVKKKK